MYKNKQTNILKAEKVEPFQWHICIYIYVGSDPPWLVSHRMSIQDVETLLVISHMVSKIGLPVANSNCMLMFGVIVITVYLYTVY